MTFSVRLRRFSSMDTAPAGLPTIPAILVGTHPDFLPSRSDQSPLASLARFFSEWLAPDAAVHLLPFYPSSGDGGFSSSSWSQVDPALGTWHDIEQLTCKRYVVVDGIYNHVGIDHPFFRNFLQDPFRYAPLFYASSGEPASQLPRSPRGRTAVRTWQVNNHPWTVWQTFTDTAVDIRVDHPEVLHHIRVQLELLKSRGFRAVRVDAPAYFGKSLAGPVRHNAESYRLARIVADEVRAAGLDMIAQLDCDVSGQEYFDDAVPLVDYAFSAHLALAVLSEDVRLLAEHLQRTWLLETPVIRAPRTHDGILMKSVNFPPEARDLLVRNASAIGITPRIIDGEPYELNSSLPFLYRGSGNTSDLRNARLHIAFALAAFVPGIAYLYLPALLGFEPEAVGTADEDPRTLNRLPVPVAFLQNLLRASFARLSSELINDLLALNLGPGDPAQRRDNDVHYVPDSALLIVRSDLSMAMLANFSSSKQAIVAPWILQSAVCTRRLHENLLDPMGFVIWPLDSSVLPFSACDCMQYR